MTAIKTRLIGVEQYRYDDDWTTNSTWVIEEDIYLDEKTLSSARQLLKFCRDCNWLTKKSIGKMTTYIDCDIVDIVIRATGETVMSFYINELAD